MSKIDSLEDQAETLFMSGNHSAALQVCEQLIKLDPDNPLNWVKAASNLQELGRVNDAIRYCDEAISIDPKESFSFIEKGICLVLLGEISEAIGAYSRSIELSPCAPAFSLRAICYMRKGVQELRLCVEFLRRGVVDKKTSHEKLAVEELKKAVSDLRRAEDLGEENDDTIDLLLAAIQQAEERGLRADELEQAVAALGGAPSA